MVQCPCLSPKILNTSFVVSILVAKDAQVKELKLRDKMVKASCCDVTQLFIQLAAGESTRPLVWPDSRRMGLKPWKIRRLIKRRPSNGSRTAK